MNLILSLCRKFEQDKFFFPLSIVICASIYSLSLNSTPFGDDFIYIFNNSHISETPHPFVFWDLTSESYKSWPLTYSLLWTLYKAFGDQYALYRAVNLLIHVINSFLAIRVLEQYTGNKSKLIFLLFLFHPLAFESIFWIFQIKTLLATSFILLAVFLSNQLEQSLSPRKTLSGIFITLTLSLFTKSVAVLFPFYLFFKVKFKLKNFLFFVIFLLLSFYVGVQNIKGITASVVNTNNIENYYKSSPSEKNALPDFAIEKNQVTKLTNTINKRRNLSLIEKYTDYFISYMPSYVQLDKISDKFIQVPLNFFFYLKMTLGFGKNWMVYPSEQKDTIFNFIAVFSFILLSYILLRNKIHANLYILILVLFIPISGLFYIPFMEYSQRTDHWFYPSFFFVIILLASILNRFKLEKVFYLILPLLIFQLLSLSCLLRSTKEYFFKNLEVTPNSVILYEYIIEIDKLKKNFRSALILTEKLLPIARSKLPIYLNLLFLTSKLDMADQFLHYQREYIVFLEENGYKELLSTELRKLSPLKDNLKTSTIRSKALPLE